MTPWRRTLRAGFNRSRDAYRRGLSRILPLRPMEGGRVVLDEQYAAGDWDYLRGIDERVRLFVVSGYWQHYAGGGRCLEIGCGEGLLRDHLPNASVTLYYGIDISENAIRAARECVAQPDDGRSIFLCADAESVELDETFDALIFNECLEYFQDPVALVDRWQRNLQDNGVSIVSMYVGRDTARTARIWKRLERNYVRLAGCKVNVSRTDAWQVRVYARR